MGNAAKSLTDELTAVASLGSTVAAVAADYGIDIAPLCGSLGIDQTATDSLTARIGLDRLCRLLEACAMLSHDEAFGLQCATRFVPGATGPFGYGLLSAPTVRDFLVFAAANMQYASHTTYCNLTFDDRFARLTWTFTPLIVQRNQYVDMAVRLILMRLKEIDAPLAQVELDLERRKPRDVGVFRELLCRRTAFECAINELRIPNAVLGHVNPRGDLRMHQMMEIQCRTFQPKTNDPDAELFDRISRYLVVRAADPDVSLTSISSYFGLSERTLQRRLADRETTLQALRDNVRKEVSYQLLTGSDLAISEIGYRLGYSAPSAFTRSVTRWFGTTPKQVRDSVDTSPRDRRAAAVG